MPQQSNTFKEDVDVLIEMGRTGMSNPTRLDSSKTTIKRLLSYRVLWESISLPEDKLKHLIKGIVLYDQSYDKQGFGFAGSVSPGITLCKKYILRFPDKEKELMSWVIDNRVNPYLPYGSYMPSDE